MRGDKSHPLCYLGFKEEEDSGRRPSQCIPPTATPSNSCHHILRRQLIPRHHLLLLDVPETDSAVKGTRDEAAVVGGVEGDAGDNVGVGEDGEAVGAGWRPQTNCGICRRRNQEIILQNINMAVNTQK